VHDAEGVSDRSVGDDAKEMRRKCRAVAYQAAERLLLGEKRGFHAGREQGEIDLDRTERERGRVLAAQQNDAASVRVAVAYSLEDPQRQRLPLARLEARCQGPGLREEGVLLGGDGETGDDLDSRRSEARRGVELVERSDG
jgi:hypothetical protein